MGRKAWVQDILSSWASISAGALLLVFSLVGTVSLEEDAGAHQPDTQESAVSNLR